MYSAATIVVAYALMVRLMVDIITAPLGTESAASDLQKSNGSATCSITCNIKKKTILLVLIDFQTT